MKTMNMISRRSFLKAAMAASAVSALALTGCGGRQHRIRCSRFLRGRFQRRGR